MTILEMNGAENVTHEKAKPRIVVFGFDVSEVSQIRRIRTLISLGYQVHSFTMRRSNMNAEFIPEWPDTHLYRTKDEALGQRMAVVAGSIIKTTRQRALIRAADVIIARNMDMLAIAVAVKKFTGSKAPIIYECLDIHRSLTGKGAKASLMRRTERALLQSVALIAVSSPGFMRHYFRPIQNYNRAYALWENKLAMGVALPPRPKERSAVSKPLKLGFIGTIRCAPSLALLDEVTRKSGGSVEVHIHGVVHYHAIPDFDRIIAQNPAIYFHGSYEYPQDLAKVYGSVDLVWGQDLWRRGGNSDWLLPNRIYEASWAGCPTLAVDGTETARRVTSDQLGWTTPTPDAEAVMNLLSSLSHADISERGTALLQAPATDFVQTPNDISNAINDLLSAESS